jgi:hypothetical protein
MRALDVAVQSIATTVTNPNERERYIGLLDAMAKDCKSAAAVWRQYLEQPGSPPADPSALIYWTGSALARQLFDIHLDCRDKLVELTNGRATMEDPMISLAYRKLAEGETGPQAAQQAVDEMNGTAAHLERLKEQIRTTQPKKAAAMTKPVAAKKAVATKKPVAAKKPAAATKAKAVVKKSATAKKAKAKPAKSAAVKTAKKASVKTAAKTVKKKVAAKKTGKAKSAVKKAKRR